jgi:alpha-beta hydrolase superfamily lysophospholipase
MHTSPITDYWRRYHNAETLARFDALHTEAHITSTGVRLHIDLYEQPDPAAPVLVINHGGGGYSRIFLPVALALYDRGYTIVVPDQRGQGLSEGNRGDFTVGQLVQNIVDVAQWAQARYRGRLFLLGGSIGGGLVYQAAAVGAPAEAVVCHNLYDFGSIHDTLAMSRFAPLRHVPGLSWVSGALIRGLTAVAPGLRIPFRALGRFRDMVDGRDAAFFPIWANDPLPVKAVTLRYMRSTFTTPPAVPFEQNTVPVLVINPTRDRMVSPAVTQHNYERLGGEKRYAEIPYGHWATGADFLSMYADIVDGYLRERLAVNSARGV